MLISDAVLLENTVQLEKVARSKGILTSDLYHFYTGAVSIEGNSIQMLDPSQASYFVETVTRLLAVRFKIFILTELSAGKSEKYAFYFTGLCDYYTGCFSGVAIQAELFKFECLRREITQEFYAARSSSSLSIYIGSGVAI